MKFLELFICSLIAASLSFTQAAELTFELADGAKQCFYEDIESKTKSILEFQVLDGGNFDVDAEVVSPTGMQIWKITRSQSDSFEFTADITGVYSVCFDNGFSSFAHKLVYFDLQVGEEKPLPGLEDHPVLTKAESAAVNIHDRVNKIIEFQTYHRLAESKSRHRAEELNARVLYWSMGESFVIITVVIGQIFILKSFFSDRK